MAYKKKKLGQKLPPKATLDLTAKDVTESDSKEKTADRRSSSSAKIPNVNVSSSYKDKPAAKKPAAKKSATSSSSQNNPTSSKTKSPSSASSSQTKDTNSTPNKTAKTRTKAKSGGGFFSNLVSAIMGGIVALFGMSFAGGSDKIMNMAGISTPTGSEISTLKQDVATLKAGDYNKTISALQQKISALEGRQQDLNAQVGSVSDEKFQKMEIALQAFEKMADGGGKSAIASAAIVKKQLKQAGVAKFKNQVMDLRKQNTTVQEEQAKLHEGMASISEEQAKLHSNIAKMREDTASLKNKSAKISSKLAQGPDLTLAMAPLLAKIKKFESQVAAVETQNKQAKSEGRNIALAIELSNLKRAISRGIPFNMELDRIRSHVPTTIDVSILDRYASEGLPNLPQLSKKLNRQMEKIMASEIEPEADDSHLSWQDRLLAKAKSTIRMRPSGNAQGAGTDAILARMDYNLTKQKNLAGALKEAKSLNEKPAKVAQGWIKIAQDKLGADKILQTIEHTLIGSLSGETTKQ